MAEKNREQPSVPAWRSQVGARIGQLADLLGSRINAASVAGISTDQLGRYISAGGEISLAPIARMAEHAGVRLDWVWTGAGPMLLGQHHAAQEGARYDMSVSDAGRFIVELENELGFDPGSAWTALLIELMTVHSLQPSGARKVLEHLASFRQAAAGSSA